MNKLVPVEPTDAMLEAALRLQGEDAFCAKAPALMSALVKIYTAMVKASPPSGGEVYCWVCTKRFEGKKEVMLHEPFFAFNPKYVEAHKNHDWKPVYTSPRVVDVDLEKNAARYLWFRENAGFSGWGGDIKVHVELSMDINESLETCRKNMDAEIDKAIQAALGEGK